MGAGTGEQWVVTSSVGSEEGEAREEQRADTSAPRQQDDRRMAEGRPGVKGAQQLPAALK